MADDFDLSLIPQAKDLTPAQHQAWVLDANGLITRLRAAQQKGREAVWEMAGVFYEMQKASAWLALGHETRAEWLDAEEISDRTFRRLVALHREFVVLRDVDRPTLAALDPSKVDITLPALRAGTTTLTEAVDDAETLSARELRQKYAEPKALPSPPPPPPDRPSMATPEPEVETANDAEDELMPTIEAEPEIVTAPAELEGLEPDLQTPDELAEEEAGAALVAALERAQAVQYAEHPRFTEQPDTERLRDALIDLARQVDDPFALSHALGALIRTATQWRAAVDGG